MGRAVARCGARPDGGDRWFEVLRNLFDRSSDPWWDDVRTTGVKETRDDVLRAAMKDTGAELRRRLGGDPRKWKWGELHRLELTNETFGDSGIGPIEWLLNRGPLRLVGGDSLVDATGSNAQTGYGVDWVPSGKHPARLWPDVLLPQGVTGVRGVVITGVGGSGGLGRGFAGCRSWRWASWSERHTRRTGRTLPAAARPRAGVRGPMVRHAAHRLVGVAALVIAAC